MIIRLGKVQENLTGDRPRLLYYPRGFIYFSFSNLQGRHVTNLKILATLDFTFQNNLQKCGFLHNDLYLLHTDYTVTYCNNRFRQSPADISKLPHPTSRQVELNR